MKIRDFTDLKVWQKSHRLVLMVYEISRGFPRNEVYALSSQIRRAAVSVTSNIAEGFSRQTSKEKIQFYYVSSGSLTEVRNQLMIARDLGYITKDKFKELNGLVIEICKMAQGLIKSIRR